MADVPAARSLPLLPEHQHGTCVSKSPGGTSGLRQGTVPAQSAEQSPLGSHGQQHIGAHSTGSVPGVRVSLTQRCWGKRVHLRGQALSPPVRYLLTCQRA